MAEVSLKALIEIFDEVVDVSGIRMCESTVLGVDFPVDSREMLRILSRIEARYKFRFEPSQIWSLRTVGDVLEVTRRRVGSDESSRAD